MGLDQDQPGWHIIWCNIYDSFGAFELKRRIMVCTYIQKASDAGAMSPPIFFCLNFLSYFTVRPQLLKYAILVTNSLHVQDLCTFVARFYLHNLCTFYAIFLLAKMQFLQIYPNIMHHIILFFGSWKSSGKYFRKKALWSELDISWRRPQLTIRLFQFVTPSFFLLPPLYFSLFLQIWLKTIKKFNPRLTKYIAICNMFGSLFVFFLTSAPSQL